MRPDGFRRLEAFGVLGMNQRNAAYIMVQNARSAFPLVDDKVLTKKLAREHGIPIPEVFFVVEDHGSIRQLPEVLAGHREFVVKPARGAGGSGIVLITDRSDGGYVTQSGRVVTTEEFNYHIASILSGIFSLEGMEDKAIIESLIHPDTVFSPVVFGGGVPDVRVIIYKGVPVMSMIRLPTEASDGKANLHRGAIGAGIDLASGRTLTAVHGSRLITVHPDTGHPVGGIAVPHWEEILITAARATEMTGLGYLGADFVLDRDRGPILLELNARPGLAIQMANQSGLRIRLERTDAAPASVFANAESRVRWAREAFATTRQAV